MPEQVWSDHGEVLGQRRDDRVPGRRVAGQAVQEQERRARSGPSVGPPMTVNHDVLEVVVAGHPDIVGYGRPVDSRSAPPRRHAFRGSPLRADGHPRAGRRLRPDGRRRPGEAQGSRGRLPGHRGDGRRARPPVRRLPVRRVGQRSCARSPMPSRPSPCTTEPVARAAPRTPLRRPAAPSLDDLRAARTRADAARRRGRPGRTAKRVSADGVLVRRHRCGGRHRASVSAAPLSSAPPASATRPSRRWPCRARPRRPHPHPRRPRRRHPTQSRRPIPTRP